MSIQLRPTARGLLALALLCGAGQPALAQATVGGASEIRVDVTSASAIASGSGARAITRVARVGDSDQGDDPAANGPGSVCEKVAQSPSGVALELCAETGSPAGSKR